MWSSAKTGYHMILHSGFLFSVAIEEPQESSNLGQTLGIGSSIVVILLILLGLIYLKL